MSSSLRVRRALLSGALILGLVAFASCTRESDSRPNLLLLTVDTLRADALECYGGPAGLGTALCSIADGGTRFEWAFATVPYTVPSVASILTSLYPSGHGVSQFASDPADEELETVAERLQAAGYRTAAFVSNPVIAADRNLDQGFQVYDDHMDRVERNRSGYTERAAKETTDAALAWLAASGETPWFLWVHYQDPHGPYDPPGSDAAVDANRRTTLPTSQSQAGYRSIPRYQVLADARDFSTYQGRYLDEILYLDGHIERLLSRIAESHANVGILFTADHGEALGEDQYFFSHGHSLSIDQIRVPFLWRSAEASMARLRNEPVSLIDVAPTLLGAAGEEIPSAYRGRDLARSSGERVLFAEHPSRGAIIRPGRYYARDLEDLSRGTRDPNTGGRLRPLPPRSLRLVPDPSTRDAFGYLDGPIPELDDMIENRENSETFPTSGNVDEATLNRLRALGYVD